MAFSPAPETKAKILVVEDEALLLFTIADDLRAAGYDVLEATNAATALKLIEREGGIDVLFTDVDMPGAINGLGLAELVHRDWPAARIIVTSGHMRLADGDLPVGGRFVAKPYTPGAIVNLIRSMPA